MPDLHPGGAEGGGGDGCVMKCTACHRVVRKHYIRIGKVVTLTVNYATGERRRFDAGSILCTAVCARSAIFSGVFDDGAKVQKWEQLWEGGSDER